MISLMCLLLNESIMFEFLHLAFKELLEADTISAFYSI